MAVVYSKVLLFDPPLIYTAPDICVFGAVSGGGYVLEPYLTITLRKLPNSISSNFCSDKVEVAYDCLK